MLREILTKTRSYRRFYEDETIAKEDLVELIEYARLSPSGSNLQPLKYMLSYTPELNKEIFPCLAWAGYLKDWDGPQEGERPAAYIVILGDTTIRKKITCDHGIVSQSILLGATEKGYGGCLIGSIKRKQLQEVLQISDEYEILLVIALGKPKEQVVLEEAINGDIKYYRDDQQTHYVPKRPLSEIIID